MFRFFSWVSLVDYNYDVWSNEPIHDGQDRKMIYCLGSFMQETYSDNRELSLRMWFIRQDGGLGPCLWMIWVDLGILRLRDRCKRVDVHSSHTSAEDNLRLWELEKNWIEIWGDIAIGKWISKQLTCLSLLRNRTVLMNITLYFVVSPIKCPCEPWNGVHVMLISPFLIIQPDYLWVHRWMHTF